MDNTKLLREKLELTQEGFARLIGVSLRTVSRWEQGVSKPDTHLKERLDSLHNLVDRLKTILEPREITRLITTPQTELKGYAPIELTNSAFAVESLRTWVEQECSAKSRALTQTSQG